MSSLATQISSIFMVGEAQPIINTRAGHSKPEQVGLQETKEIRPEGYISSAILEQTGVLIHKRTLTMVLTEGFREISFLKGGGVLNNLFTIKKIVSFNIQEL